MQKIRATRVENSLFKGFNNLFYNTTNTHARTRRQSRNTAYIENGGAVEKISYRGVRGVENEFGKVDNGSGNCSVKILFYDPWLNSQC